MPFAILKYRVNQVIRQPITDGVSVNSPIAQSSVKTAIGADPQCAQPIFEHALDDSGLEIIRDAEINSCNLHLIGCGFHAEETIAGAAPDDARMILQQ